MAFQVSGLEAPNCVRQIDRSGEVPLHPDLPRSWTCGEHHTTTSNPLACAEHSLAFSQHMQCTIMEVDDSTDMFTCTQHLPLIEDLGWRPDDRLVFVRCRWTVGRDDLTPTCTLGLSWSETSIHADKLGLLVDHTASSCHSGHCAKVPRGGPRWAAVAVDESMTTITSPSCLLPSSLSLGSSCLARRNELHHRLGRYQKKLLER